MHIHLWFRLAAGEGAMNFSSSQKNETPPPPFQFVSFLSVCFSFFICSQRLHVCCLASLCCSRLCFLLPVSFTPPDSIAASPLYISLHNCFSLTLTPPSSSMSALTSACLLSACSLITANSLSPWLSCKAKSTWLPVSGSGGLISLRSNKRLWL